MTQEEIEQFKDTIVKTIIPLVQNMTEAQIKVTIESVQNSNPQLPSGFGNMLYEQILLMKYNKKI